VDEGFKHQRCKGDGKVRKARVRKDGMIVFRDKEYTSPSSAGDAALPERSIDGWQFWKLKKEWRSNVTEYRCAARSRRSRLSPRQASQGQEPKLNLPTALLHRQEAQAASKENPATQT